MFYISSKRPDGRYGVTDTKDGVEEFFTVPELIDIVANKGINIKGTSYGSRSELINSGFWGIRVEPKKRVISLQVGRYYSVSHNTSRGVVQTIGYLYKMDTSSYDIFNFITSTGELRKVVNDDIVSVSDYKPSQDVKALFKEMISLLDQANSLEISIKNSNSMLAQVRDKIHQMPSKFLATSGLLTRANFVNKIIKNMSQSTKNSLSKYNFYQDTPCDVDLDENKYLYFTMRKRVCNGYDCSFVRREYDGNLFMGNKDANYKRVLKESRVFSPLVEFQMKDCLIIVEHNVYYQAWYEIGLGDVYNQENAMKIAKTIY